MNIYRVVKLPCPLLVAQRVPEGKREAVTNLHFFSKFASKRPGVAGRISMIMILEFHSETEGQIK